MEFKIEPSINERHEIRNLRQFILSEIKTVLKEHKKEIFDEIKEELLDDFNDNTSNCHASLINIENILAEILKKGIKIKIDS